MNKEICKLLIDSKEFSFEVEGDFSWGPYENTFIEKNNVISNTSWINDGYKIINNFFCDSDEFNLFKSEVRDNIIQAMKLNKVSCEYSTFRLEDYHEIVKDDKLHRKIIGFTRELTEKNFSLDIYKLLERAEDVLSCKLSLMVKELNRVHIQLRINRPNSLDINPPHKDGYLSYWKDIINIWIPISGCDINSSLPLMPESHLIRENELYKTQNKGASINGSQYRVPCILKTKNGNLKMIRPNPKEGDAIFFTPFLIHGAAFNKSKKTRIGMELRFPKFENN